MTLQGFGCLGKRSWSYRLSVGVLTYLSLLLPSVDKCLLCACNAPITRILPPSTHVTRRKRVLASIVLPQSCTPHARLEYRFFRRFSLLPLYTLNPRKWNSKVRTVAQWERKGNRQQGKGGCFKRRHSCRSPLLFFSHDHQTESAGKHFFRNGR